MKNIEHLLQYPDFEFIKYDVNEPIDPTSFDGLEKFKIEFQGIQEIYHLACPTSPKNFEDLKIHSLHANSNAMISTLNLAVKNKAKYVFASSSVVYGNPTENNKIFSEEYEGVVNHLSPRACYDEGKRFAETCVDTYRQVYGLDLKIARVFTTYGPKMKLRDGLLVPDFIVDALEGKDLVIYGDGELEQSFCYISDMVDGLVRLMQSDPEVSIVNLGHDTAYKIKDVAEKIIQMTDSDSQIRYEDALVFLTKKGLPNLTRAKENLEWIPLVNLEKGLKNTINYAIANKESISYED